MFKILLNLVIGGIAGFVAGKIRVFEGNLVRNILLGLVGGVLGSIVLAIIGIHGSGFIGSIIVSIVGSCLLIWIVRKLKQ